MSKKNKGGRPMKYPTPELLQEAVDLYFESLVQVDEETGETLRTPPTVSGLAYALDMETETVRAYGEKDKFSAIIKRAKQQVEIALEGRLYGTAPTGAIFNLKCNFNYRDSDDVRKEDKQATTAINFVVSDRVEHD